MFEKIISSIRQEIVSFFIFVIRNVSIMLFKHLSIYVHLINVQCEIY